MSKLTIEQQNELINTVTNIHSIGLYLVPLLFILTFAAVLFTRRNKAGNIALAIYFFLVLVLIGSCPEPITKLWLSLSALTAGGYSYFLQSLHHKGTTFVQWLSDRGVKLPSQGKK